MMTAPKYLLDVRQALRGGRRREKGSRHWDMEDEQ